MEAVTDRPGKRAPKAPPRVAALRAAFAQGAAAFVAAIRAAKAEGAYGPHEKRLCLRLLTRYELAGDPSAMTEIIGGVPTSAAEAEAALDVALIPEAQARRALNLVRQVTGQPIADPQAWLDRLQQGARMFQARMVMNRVNKDLPPDREAQQAAAAELRAVSNGAVVIDALEKGRNVILLAFHGNRSPTFAPLMQHISEKNVPIAEVGNYASERVRDNRQVVDPLAADFVLQFAKLSKAMKAGGPRVLTLYPDGQMGGSFREIDIGGHQVKMGLGAATLAYFGRAAVFICQPRLVDGVYGVEYVPGPDIGPDLDKAAVEDLVVEAYRAGFIEFLGRDPIFFGLLGHFWKTLLQGETA